MSEASDEENCEERCVAGVSGCVGVGVVNAV